MQRAEVDGGLRPGRSTDDAEHIAQLEREVRELRRANAILRNGVRKVHAQFRREGHVFARCTIERLMRRDGLRGVTRHRGPRTTVPGDPAELPMDLVERAFTATAPDQLWVADIERHEALLNLAVVKGHRSTPVAAGV